MHNIREWLVWTLCEVGDAIMADKGFLISDLCTPRGVSLIIPFTYKTSEKIPAT